MWGKVVGGGTSRVRVVFVNSRAGFGIRGSRHSGKRIEYKSALARATLQHLREVVEDVVGVIGFIIQPGGIFKHLGQPPEAIRAGLVFLSGRIGSCYAIAGVGRCALPAVWSGDGGCAAEGVLTI